VVLDDFGGGNILSRSLTPPVAIINAPAESSFYAAGDTIRLEGSTMDENSTPRFRWEVDTHHNNHVHPGTFVSGHATDLFIGQNHDDGTGVFLRARLIVTDAGFSDTASVDLFPETDLTPSEVALVPAPDSAGDEQYRFWIRNRGRMLAPRSRWVMQVDGTEIGHGDTTVAALDSVQISLRAKPLADGLHALRVTVDSLNTVVETDESNNVREQDLGSEWSTLFVNAPRVRALSMVALVFWVAKESGLGTVYYGTTVDLGDSVVARRDTTVHRLLLRGLEPDTRYYFMVTVPDSAGHIHLGPVTSFVTKSDTSTIAPAGIRNFGLSAPFPTPSRGDVRFTAQIPRRSRVRIQVFDLQGRAIWTDRDRDLQRGSRTLSWPGTDANGVRVRPGLYLARVELDRHVYLRRILLVP
jgi:hypothetical protein